MPVASPRRMPGPGVPKNPDGLVPSSLVEGEFPLDATRRER